MGSYTTIDYLPDLTSTEMRNADTLIFQPYSSSSSYISWDNIAGDFGSENYALLHANYKFTGQEGATYDIFSTSYFDPFLLEVFDQYGNVIEVNDEYDDGADVYLGDGGYYSQDIIWDWVAPYSGTYYVNASWNQGSYYTYYGINIYEDEDTALPSDTTAPRVISFSPSDGATGVDLSDNISLTFNESIQRGDGLILLQDSAGHTVESFSASSSSRLSISGSTLTINPTADLDYSSDYNVVFIPGSIKDLAGNSYSGTSNYNFSTEAQPDTTAPRVISFSPRDGATGVCLRAYISLTFNESIQRGDGLILLQDSAGHTVESFSASSSSRLSISGSTLTINPTADLDYSSDYNVVFIPGSIKDLAGNSYSGTSNYNFSTEQPPLSDYVNDIMAPNGDASNTLTSAVIVTPDAFSSLLISGFTGNCGDRGDYYSFTAPQSGETEIVLSGFAGSIFTTLYDAQGEQVETTFGHAADDMVMTPTLVDGETYIVAVKPDLFGERVGSNYELRLTMPGAEISDDLPISMSEAETVSESHTLSVIVDQGVLGIDPVLLKGLNEFMSTENEIITEHTVNYNGTTLNYDDIDDLIATVTRDGDFTEEFRYEISDLAPSFSDISYQDAVALIGVANIDATLMSVAGADGMYVA